MRPANGDIRPHDLHPLNVVTKLSPGATISQVQLACCDVVERLSDYSLSIEGDVGDINIEPHLAKAQFEKALDQLRSERCQTLHDAWAKCSVFARLDASLDQDDHRLRGYSRDLLLELADLLHQPSTTFSQLKTDAHAMGMTGD